MNAPTIGGFVEVGDLTDRAFERLRQTVLRECGIVLGPHKKPLVRCRLQPRLRSLRMKSYDQYVDLLENHDPDRQELAELLDRITTNQTHFFRERIHIDHVAGEFLDSILEAGPPREIRGWCAACSMGQEPASILMAMLDRLPGGGRWDVKILGTDLSRRALQKAMSGRYTESEMSSLPEPLRKRWTSPVSGGYQLSRDLLRRVKFARLNLLRESFPLRSDVDFVFCRNVMIYFDGPTRAALVRRLMSHIRPGGLLALGVAEALIDKVPGLQPITTSLYRRTG
jgi:chemotaxis protein methyltransferase CheR